MKEEILRLVIGNISEIVFALIGMLISLYLVPWLKEKKLYEQVKIAVGAAEKLAQSCEIDKLQWVKAKLGEAGIKLTPAVEIMIESAVSELDALLKKSES